MEGDTHILAADGKEYRYKQDGMGLSRALTAFGGTLSGMLSTGLGEIELPQLVRICHLPLPVAAGTSILIVTAAVAAGSVTHVAHLLSEGGLSAVPWNLVLYTIPGAIIGGQIGAKLQGTVREATMEQFMAGRAVRGHRHRVSSERVAAGRTALARGGGSDPLIPSLQRSRS